LVRTERDRLVTRDEVAAATAFLLASEAVNADDLVADGGCS